MRRPFSTAATSVFARKEQFGWKEAFLQRWNTGSWILSRQSMLQSHMMFKIHQRYRQHGLWYWGFFANAIATYWISTKLSKE